MNKEQLQQQIEDMKNKLVEMEAELNKPEVTINYWQPKEEMENMYYINYLGNVSTSYYTKKYHADEIRYEVFKTKEEAERYAEYIKAKETLRRVIAEANKGWIPDWNGYEINYLIRLYNNNLECLYYSNSKILPNFMYIKSKDLCYKLMEEYEKEFKTYLSY